MQKHLIHYFLLFITFLTTSASAQILQDEAGKKYITIGSSKDEVLEILGTPSKIDASWNWWYYGYDHLSFDGKDRVRDYTDAKKLKILLRPSKKQTDIIDVSSSSASDTTPKLPLTLNATNVSNSKTTSASLSSPSSSSFNSSASGYGEISEKTGRPKTVHVNGYYRKDGTYVKPHYRSSPRK